MKERRCKKNEKQQHEKERKMNEASCLHKKLFFFQQKWGKKIKQKIKGELWVPAGVFIQTQTLRRSFYTFHCGTTLAGQYIPSNIGPQSVSETEKKREEEKMKKEKNKRQNETGDLVTGQCLVGRVVGVVMMVE